MPDPDYDEELIDRFDFTEEEVTVEFVPEGSEGPDEDADVGDTDVDEGSETWQWDGERWTKVSASLSAKVGPQVTPLFSKEPE